jgi:anaerobic dimethyl sulfoxide reductase subunit A
MTDEKLITKTLADTALSRRSFMKWSAALGGAAALAGGGLKFGLKAAEQAAAESGITIVPSGGYHNCGGRCILKGWVKDGTVIRITPDDRPDRIDNPQLRACPRGHAYRRRLYNPDRIKYPMKRVGERGEAKFEQISWDEATSMVAEAMQRIKDKYGNYAFINHYASGGEGLFDGSQMPAKLLSLFGGYLNEYGSYSAAQFEFITPLVIGYSESAGNSRSDLHNAKLMLMDGWNPAEMIWGTNTHYYIKLARESGTKVILIEPRLSMTAHSLVDEWIPIRPGTDVALFSAMAYVMITENLQDQAFLDKYCIGFDEAHMPEGIPSGNSYKSYVLGTSDGTPKTPQWAEYYTQIPAERIIHLAREFALTKPAMFCQGFGVQRRAYGVEVVHAMWTLLAMTGNYGKSGTGSNHAPTRVPVGSFSASNPIKTAIPTFRWTHAIEEGHKMGAKDGVRSLPEGMDTLPTDIKFIYNCAGDTLINQHSDVNRTAEILRDTSKVEFIASHVQFMDPSAKFADVLMPCVTQWEHNDMSTTWVVGDSLIFLNQAIEPMYECKTDYEICAMVADKLGLGNAFTEGKNEMQWLEEMVKVSQQADPSFPFFDEFRKKGVHIFQYEKPVINYENFVKDPKANPLSTASGKIEIFCKAVRDMQTQDLPAVPQFIPEWEGGPWDPLFKKYPLQAMGHHFQVRSHSTFWMDDWLHEAMPQRVFMNPMDAKERGIEDGDLVRVFNDRGEMIIPVRVTVRMMPGQVDIPSGAWWTPNKSKIDQGGCINVLTTYRYCPGSFGNPQQTNLVQVEKA